MAQLPNTYARRPTPKFGGVDQAAPVVPTGGEEYGRGMMALGASITKLGAQVQAKEDRTELASRTTQYQRELLGIQNEMSQIRGANVAEDPDFYQKWQDRENELRQKVLGETQNKRITADLENRLDLGNINFSRGLLNHIEREREQYNNDTYVGIIETSIDTMGANPDDPSMTAQMRDQIVNATEEYAGRKGVKGAALENMIRKNLTEGHLEVIEAKVNQGDYRDAEEYFAEFKDEIEGDKHTEIKSKLRQSGIRGQSQAAVDDYIARGLTRSEAKAEARKAYKDNPMLRDATVDRIEARYSEIKNSETRLMKETFDSELADYEDLVAGGATPTEAYAALSETALFDMGGANQHRLRRIMEADIASRGGSTVKTDMVAYFELDSFIREDPARAQRELNLASYRHVISPTDLKGLNTLMHTDPGDLLSQTQILNNGIMAMGLDPKKTTDPDSSEGKKIRAYREWVRRELPPKHTKAELEEAVNRGVIKVITDQGRLWDTTEFVYTVGTEFTVPGVPDENVDELAEAIQTIGLAPTIENIQIAEALRVGGMPITLVNFEAMRADDVSLPPIAPPQYERFSQDFPGG